MDMYNDLLTVRSIYNIITVVMGSEGVTAERKQDKKHVRNNM